MRTNGGGRTERRCAGRRANGRLKSPVTGREFSRLPAMTVNSKIREKTRCYRAGNDAPLHFFFAPVGLCPCHLGFTFRPAPRKGVPSPLWDVLHVRRGFLNSASAAVPEPRRHMYIKLIQTFADKIADPWVYFVY